MAAAGVSTVAAGNGADASDLHPPAHFPQWKDDMVPDLNESGARDLVTTFLFSVVCLAMVAVIGVLIWQVISFLRIVSGV